MKKLFTLLLALMAITALWAEDFSVDGIYYKILNGSEVEVTYRGSSYNEYADEYSGSVIIPSTITYNGTTYSVTSIGNSAFYKCSSLISVIIPNRVTSIGDGAFVYCSSLTSVIIPNSVTSIGDFAFDGCSRLSFVTLPKRVTSIGDYAFRDCSSLSFVTLSKRVTSIGALAFTGCSGLISIIVEDANSKYDSRNNCNAIIETATNTLIVGCKNTTIPNSVTSIGDAAFSGCSGLTSVIIPNSVTSIGYYAFDRCSSLTSVTIGNSVTSIEGAAFSECSALTSITIPNSVTSIGTLAFAFCSGLTSITSLAEVPPTLGDGVFFEVFPVSIYVPCTSSADYQSAEDWKYFTNIQCILE